MDASRSSLCQEDVTELLSMLESPDMQTVESVKALIHENLTGTKDVWLLHGLVDYYIAFQSKHALEVLVRVREPHDKHLFDKITDYMKHENTRYQCLLLLSHIVHSQPPWLHKIAHHRIFQTLLSLLKSEKDSPSLLCALFITVCLLPMIPSQIGPFLSDIFEIFSRLASWSIKNSIGVPEIYVLHLQVGVYALFHRLYGMYPCNFLGYLRSYYGRREYNEENICVFTNAIKPMLQKVKLHPLLVTACKETELSSKRWKRMAPHDVIVECANISFDAIESGGEDMQSKSNTCSSAFSCQTYSLNNEAGSQYISYNNQNSTPFVVESNSAVNNAMTTKQETLWSPSLACDSTASQILQTSSELDSSFKQTYSDSASQVALNSELLFSDDTSEKNTNSKDACCHDSTQTHANSLSERTAENDITEALEAKEEELADQEVCELTSLPPLSNSHEHFEIRHDTPFCSTTQNLTDKPKIPEVRATVLAKDEENSYEQTDVISHEQSEIKIENFVRTMNRLRYFSHCGVHPDISNEQYNKPVVHRSSSCPDIQSLHSSFEICGGIKETPNLIADISPIAPISANTNSYCQNSVSVNSTFECSLPLTDTPYDHLIPMVMPSVSNSENVTGSHKPQSSIACIRSVENSSSLNFTPSELLDRHILLSNEIYLGQLSSIPLTSTKSTHWTHFGGKPPPDEITMLQTQILLLHNQLMFERHRCEIHKERNRRLLGKARRTRMQEEYTAALKDQVSLLERENDKLRKQIDELQELYNSVSQEKKNSDHDFNCVIKKLLQEKSCLQYSNKNLQGLLVDQKQQIEAIKGDHELSQSKITDLEFEIEVLKHDKTSLCNSVGELMRVSKENALLHELNEIYIDQLEAKKEPIVANDTVDLQKDAASFEIKGLKNLLDLKTSQLDIGLARITELEVECSSLKLKMLQLSELEENMKALHTDEISAREDRLLALQRIIHQNETHILQLYHVIDQLNDEIRILKRNHARRNASNDTLTVPLDKEYSADIDCHKENEDFDNLSVPNE